MATWNTDNPKIGNTIAADIPDIEENLQELHEAVGQHAPGINMRPKFTFCETVSYTGGGTHEVLVGDTLTGATGGGTGVVVALTLTSGTWAGGTAAGVLYLNTRNATAFQAEDLNEGANANVCTIGAATVKDGIVLSPFVYHHNGTTEQLVYADLNVPFKFANLAVFDMSYLYLDDSAIVTAGTNVITASELIDSTTEPAWSAAKHGWYSGEDKCIFAVLTNWSSNILEFFHDGDYMAYADDIAELASTDIDTTWTDIDVKSSIPKFTTRAICQFYTLFGNAATESFWRTNGQSGSTGKRIAQASVGNTLVSNTIEVLSDASQIIEVKHAASNTSTASMKVHGWYFPSGM